MAFPTVTIPAYWGPLPVAEGADLGLLWRLALDAVFSHLMRVTESGGSVGYNAIVDPEHVQLVRRFATWEVLPKLRTRAEKKPLTPASRRYAGDQVKHATAFLRWLAEHGLTLPTCRQTDIDAWHVEHNEHGRNTIRPFLLWCMASKLTRRFRLPTAVIRQASPLSQHKRVDLLGRVLTDHE